VALAFFLTLFLLFFFALVLLGIEFFDCIGIQIFYLEIIIANLGPHCFQELENCLFIKGQF
jgi:hypothetical protein